MWPPCTAQTCQEFVENDALGGSLGYVVTRQSRGRYEGLAKTANLEAAREIFALITKGARVASEAGHVSAADPAAG